MRVVLKEGAVARDAGDRADGLLERGAQLVTHRLELGRAKLRVVVEGDGGLRLGELQLNQVDEALEEGPVAVTSGFSGPMISRLILLLIKKFLTCSKSLISISIFVAISSVPALPGMQKIFFGLFDFLIYSQIACSLPPLPIMAIFIYIYIN